MPGERGRLRNIICIILCVLAACGFGYLYYTWQQREAAYSAALEAQQEEAQPYETELWSLQTELAGLEEDYVYSSQTAGLMAGFLISAKSDLESIESLAQEYDFTPVLVIDCTMERDEILAILEEAPTEWEIMLYATGFTETVNEDVLFVLSDLESIGRTQTGIFFLRLDDYSDAAIALLKEDGFIGYTVYNESTPAAGQAADGAVYFDYSYLSVTGTLIESRLSACYNAGAFMIVVFDMANISDGTLPEDYVQQLLGIMRSYTEYDDCTFITVADAAAELSHVNEYGAQYQTAYEARAAEIRERIEELKDTIAGIYGR